MISVLTNIVKKANKEDKCSTLLAFLNDKLSLLSILLKKCFNYSNFTLKTGISDLYKTVSVTPIW
ncbi:hypothetical protein Cycma_2710 [Cyclobacterium marinum DSM 745]|uniref:Uncharacterized protein n=1 Tax=Cyclobacterium marinum (strain ATCC 25205 / DSM 745 / LMG 13164 / NCIMB 1802) TaxID=880070 RepID=G0IYM6_CYCMS|nr:hypothetical protein Cycma_2710 [Cyclobacterium marinum DSM 745]